MRNNLLIYYRLLRAQFRSQLQYRTSFLFLIFGTALISVLEFSALALALQKFDNIRGWTIAEVAFLYSLVEISFGAMDMIFAGFDPQNFGTNIRKGTIDQILLRPVSTILQVFASDFALQRIGRIVMGIVIFLLAIQLNPIAWNAVKIVLIPIIIISMISFFGGLYMIGATISFWTVETIEVVNILTYGGSYLISYPMHIYEGWLKRIFTFVIPAIFLNYYPSVFILSKTDPGGMPAWAPFVSPLVGMITVMIAVTFWQFGIRNYQSTGT